MIIIGLFAAVIIGISLGLIGGGGSILTVPVLVYIFHVETVLATGYSLFIVGVTSLVGSMSYFRSKLINLKTAIIFGIPSFISVYLTRAFVIPSVPDEIMQWGDFLLTKDRFLLILFSVLMIGASYSMIKKPKLISKEEDSHQVFNYPLILLEGVVVGFLTGLVGAGGGFLIIPALVVFSKLPMKEAVGTSLLIIATKSLVGFTGEIGRYAIDWYFLIGISVVAVIGIFLGTLLSKKMNGEQLKPAFGWFTLVMGIYIIVKELFL